MKKYEMSLELIFANKYLQDNVEFKGMRYKEGKFPSIDFYIYDAFKNVKIPEDENIQENVMSEIWDFVMSSISDFETENNCKILASDDNYTLFLQTGVYFSIEQHKSELETLRQHIEIYNDSEGQHQAEFGDWIEADIDELEYQEKQILKEIKTVIAFVEFCRALKEDVKNYFKDHVEIHNKKLGESNFVAKWEFDELHKKMGWTKKRKLNENIHA